MVSPLLAKSAPTGREIVNVTPERAGWTHVGFRAVRLQPGESETVDTGTRELCLVVLTGTVDVTVDGASYANLGTRKSVFEEVSPAAVYAPAGKTVTVSNATGAMGLAEVALCTAPGQGGSGEVSVIDSGAMRRSVRQHRGSDSEEFFFSVTKLVAVLRRMQREGVVLEQWANAPLDQVQQWLEDLKIDTHEE